jgi:hypothetical protein
MRTRLVLALSFVLAAAPFARAQPQPVQTVLDTAIGGDIDQAFGLMYALTSPGIDLRAVTTVGDQAEDRAWIVCRLLTQGESRKLPVIAGAEPQPKLGIDWQIQYRRHPAPIYNRTQKPEKTTAVEWLSKFLANESVPTTLLATGPLTNVARLFKEHPEAAKRIERIVCVGSARNLGADVAAARAVLASGVPLTFVAPELAASAKLEKKDRDELFGLHVPLSFQVQSLYELWDRETPGLAAAVAAADVPLSSSPKKADAHVAIDDAGKLHVADGKPNARLLTKAELPVLVARLIYGVKVRGKIALPAEPKNLSKLIDRGAFPAKVHVAEDCDTDIEKRWWMSGKAETKDIPPGGVRCLRGVLTQDFDDRQGDMRTSYRAVVFNPVPGPPMGKKTRLAFRYKLVGTDHLRVQLYSLTNGYHRYLSVKGLPENEWRSGAVDMTEMRRPDGTGGPLSENERIDDIQFYVDPRAQVLIDDVVLYDAAVPGEKRPFPKRILYTAWFDTGKHGKEWLGDFAIVNHDAPRTGKAARSVARGGTTEEWIRLDLKGPRRLGETVDVGFKHLVTGSDKLRVELHSSATGRTWKCDLVDLPRDRWSESTARFEVGAGAEFADEVRFQATPGQTVTVDDVLVYVP